MKPALREYYFRFCVGITVLTEMLTGIIGPYVTCKITGKFLLTLGKRSMKLCS